MSARRDWFAVQCRLFRLPKFRRLSDAAQLTLIYVWGIAGDETPEALWRTVDHLALALQLHGRDQGTIEELRAGGWLDTLEDGSVVVHDWDEHQVAASREIKNAWEASRLRKWRKARASTPTSSSTQAQTQTSTSTQAPVRSSTYEERTEVQASTNGAVQPSKEEAEVVYNAIEEFRRQRAEMGL
jgi:hypothetical protein